jgi:hypothetical protein
MSVARFMTDPHEMRAVVGRCDVHGQTVKDLTQISPAQQGSRFGGSARSRANHSNTSRASYVRSKDEQFFPNRTAGDADDSG